MRKTIVGVIGPGRDAGTGEIEAAFEVGKLIALEGWVLLSGGRDVGVMDAAHQGAKSAHGLTIGILPTEDTAGMSTAVDIPIVTGMGQARNNINVLSSEVLIACGLGAGTASEIALAIKAQKRVILLGGNQEGRAFFKSLGKDGVYLVDNPQQAIDTAKRLVGL